MLGIRNTMRFAALIFLCLGVASATAQATSTRPVKIQAVSITTTLTTATFSVTTNVPTAITVSTGVARQVTVPTLDASYKIRHTITVPGLAFHTAFVAQLAAADKTGKKVAVWKNFQTAAPGSVPATVTTSGSKLLLNNRPWFASIAGVSSVCPSDEVVKANAHLGIPVLARESGWTCAQSNDPNVWSSLLHQELQGQMFWLEYQAAGDKATPPAAFPELLGWQAPLRPFVHAPSLAYACDSQGFGEPTLFDSMKSASSGKAVIFSVNLLAQATRKNCLTGSTLARIFWSVVAAGGAGTEFATQEASSTQNNGNGPVNVDPDVGRQAKLESLQVATLGPALLTGKKLDIRPGKNDSVKWAAWKYGGGLYVVAINSTDKIAHATMTVPGLAKSQVAKRLWESGNARVMSGAVYDDFQPAAVHFYRIYKQKK